MEAGRCFGMDWRAGGLAGCLSLRARRERFGGREVRVLKRLRGWKGGRTSGLGVRYRLF